jgi:hypothetical protein
MGNREKLEALFARQPLRLAKGLVSAHIAYPVAERMEKRVARPKLAEKCSHYRLPFERRLKIARNRLTPLIRYATGDLAPVFLGESDALDFLRLKSAAKILEEDQGFKVAIPRQQHERTGAHSLAAEFKGQSFEAAAGGVFS